ncbi:hypothetical protein [Selenomonas sp. F0473]|uniref:hypothetical protein n=1 Tax=Selenomonas sp. F0473 TaxID=999423 RepID=UPI0025EBCC05|nr:hypothetical protein [Selenomonas sp. F0473]
MFEQIDIDNSIYTVNFPNECPLCSKGVQPVFKSGYCHNNHAFFGIFLCPLCEQIFFCVFELISHLSKYEPVSTLPPPKPQLDISPEIRKYSPDFYAIYQQSIEAENRHMDKICGMGYRKAVEFLVKDYLIQKHPDEKENIKKEPLSQSIDRIKNQSIKDLSKASTWLGNDQTHYTAKHLNYHIEHLRGFIRALCHHILMEQEVSSAQKLLSSR